MNKNLSKSLVINYSLIAIPLALIGLPLFIYLPTFYAKEVGLEIGIVGLILFIARLTDVFTDPFFGHLSDKSIEYFQSRKPLMLLGSIILIFSFYFLINPNLEYTKSWLLFFTIFIYIGWSMINIPYLSWSSEISFRYEDKSTLNSSRELFTILGIIIALLIPYLLEVSQNPKETLNTLFLSFLLLFFPFFLFTMIKMKTIKINKSVKNEKNNFSLKNLKNIYKNLDDLKYLQTAYFFNNFANALPATLFLFFIEFFIKEKDSSGIILLLYFLSGLIALPFWNILSNKIGKKNTWIISILLASSAFIFVPFLGEHELTAFLIISLISGLSLGADMAMPTSMQSDLAQKASTFQENITGLLFGIWTMITKLSLAFAVAFGFIILEVFDFNSSNPNSKSLLVLSLLYGLAPVLLKILALIFITKYKDSKL